MPRRLAPPDPPLAENGIRLEPLARRDVPDAWRMAQDVDVKRFTFLPSDADQEWISGWIARYEAGWQEGSRAGFSIRSAEAGRPFLGFAALVRVDLDGREGEIGYVLAPAARGRGAATAAVSLLTRWAFDELGLERLELRIDAANAPSVRVAERVGYRLDGMLRSLYFKEGRRADTGSWSRLRSDPAPGQ